MHSPATCPPNRGKARTFWKYEFGIDEHKRDTGWYSRVNRAPRALVGWNKKVITSGVIDSGHTSFILTFFSGWRGTSKELEVALRDASAVELGKLRIYGAADLKD